MVVERIKFIDNLLNNEIYNISKKLAYKFNQRAFDEHTLLLSPRTSLFEIHL